MAVPSPGWTGWKQPSPSLTWILGCVHDPILCDPKQGQSLVSDPWSLRSLMGHNTRTVSLCWSWGSTFGPQQVFTPTCHAFHKMWHFRIVIDYGFYRITSRDHVASYFRNPPSQRRQRRGPTMSLLDLVDCRNLWRFCFCFLLPPCLLLLLFSLCFSVKWWGS